MYDIPRYYIGMACILIGVGCFMYALAGVLMRLIAVVIGYKLVDVGLRMCGYPPISYWISWARAQWRLW